MTGLTMWGQTASIFQKEGWRGFFKGVHPAAMRSGGKGAIEFFIFENLRALLLGENMRNVQQHIQKVKYWRGDSWFADPCGDP